ncbi:MAG: hypothetical protein JW932_11620 [Deltaproteobacteria bacterium]|nr:hypothetical protein [Deltaproteobacteria bacterium]
MGFTIEQTCPQCGGAIELDETDHLLSCPYCGVKNYIFAPNYFRYALPHKAPNKNIIYAPFLRFKGNVFFCKDMSVGHRVVDIAHVGLDLKGLPVSLGLRPQAMKVTFVTPETEGTFLKFTLKASEIVDRAGRLSSGRLSDQVLHRTYIGETMSVIYLPLYTEKDMLFDAILNRPIAKLANGDEAFEPFIHKNPKWDLTFMATLCPQCGWNLEGDRDSVILTCANCDTAWEVRQGAFDRIQHKVVPGRNPECVYLPFWKTSATAREGVEIQSFADFIRITNQPRVLGKEWDNAPMHFWSPAFKIRPKVFLNLSRQFTISQKTYHSEEGIKGKRLYSVTLPWTEAAQSMKVLLASSTLTKNRVYPYLPQIRFEVGRSELIYLPFMEKGHEMIQEDMDISINKNSLEFGRSL